MGHSTGPRLAGTTKQLTDADRSKIISLLSAGLSLRLVAERYGLNPKTVRAIRKAQAK